ncbi:response regulator transcription factor [Mycobacterium sherrisii]|uniref:response regulator transcription factor n=1 Tax=Mycobacterium sherrisii TaxID=243061 RepID=UPI000A14E9EC|nr:response regulator transcription factor [Mycobacterium sherrisii]MCV7032299.1 response regulator transcription factor [Mycobacterium sherrisii]MEC4764266.1 response regulator transcription factor [Mycobacterium sherrisii]ORW74555.1 hypothetical protein AWC25_16460 [Mycobacterium sherrisii]
MGATVVIIDDDERFRALIRNLLNRRGFSVVAATADGTSGVAAVDRYHPDCALIDVHLPDADGYELAARLRHRHPELAVLVVSTDTDAADVPGVRFVAKDRIADADLGALFTDR